MKNADHTKGNIAYVSSSAVSNGVDDFVSNIYGVRMFMNCLTLANSGSVGKAFYHPYEFVASDHVTKLVNVKYDKYIYMFMASMLERSASKYGFNREINDKRIRSERIMLPVDANGEPDYQFMRQYMLQNQCRILRRVVECMLHAA